MAREIQKRISFLVCVISAAALISDPFLQSRAHAADKAVASVIHVDKAKRQVHVSNPKNSSFKMGETLSLRVEGQVVVLRVKTPMASQSYCVIEQGSESLGKIAKGMFVYRWVVKDGDDEVKPGDTRTFAGIEMVLLPAGKVPSFWIGKYEVTQRQYESVTGDNPSYFKGIFNSKHPVEWVNWYMAVEFCNILSEKAGLRPYYMIDKNLKDSENRNMDDTIKWTVRINKGANGFRLPTSEEWEYACRAGTKTKYYWGDSDSEARDYCWYRKNSGKSTHPVGKKKPNAWGLYDMSGNVSEWCFDWYPDNRNSYRIYRGGCWSSIPTAMESGFVIYGSPRLYDHLRGIRLARNK